MSWLSTRTSVALVVAMVLIMHASGAAAQSLESAVMPGLVIQGHAQFESTCEKCHVRFDRAAQRKLCMDCHKVVAVDVRSGTGYHGYLDKREQRECRTCHTEHKGREAKIVQLEETTFDHAQTDFPLIGKHRGRACTSCHRVKVKYAQASSDCVACHRKDDNSKGHKGGLGQKCASCHNENTWKDTRFDHAKTRFPLRLTHADSKVKCIDCHINDKYVETPQDCVSCHRKDDNDKGHRTHFGARCDSCHNEGVWKQATFRHDRDTKFILLDRHRSTRCESCHRSPLFKEKTPTRCYACHRGDDSDKGHRGTLGDKCDKCHNAKGWKGTSFDHDRDTKFLLRDKHQAAKCNRCHKDTSRAEKLPLKCAACHEREDKEKGHKGEYGDKCESCHNERGFKPSTFDHGRGTKFLLQGRHSKLACRECHRGPLYLNRTESTCYACHKKDDVHFGSFDLLCNKCHVADNWRKVISQEGIQPTMLAPTQERTP